MSKLTFHIITIFPSMFDSYLSESMLRRAAEDEHISVKFYYPRDFAEDKHKTVDDKPYGGGPGMVMRVDPMLKAIESALAHADKDKTRVLIFSPSGTHFTNDYAEALKSEYTDIILVAGRYEGIDARVGHILTDDGYDIDHVSIGPYTLTGGELPAMIVVDAVTRRLSGVLGNEESVEEHRIASPDMYTRPEQYEHKGKEYGVPEVLLSGNHKEILEWREKRKDNAS